MPSVRPNIAEMQGYTPGEQPQGVEKFIKLNTNENPFPPSPQVMRAIRAIEPETPHERGEKSATGSVAPPRRLNEFADS